MERKLIEKHLTSLVNRHIADKAWQRDVMERLEDEHGIPVRESQNLLAKWEMFENVSEDLLACFILIVDDEKSWKTYLSDKEIKQYKKWKRESNKFKFPLKFRVVQIASDQWIGVTSVEQLQTLWNAQLVKYDPNAQRPLERKVIHGQDVYQIFLNNSAVDAIQGSYHNESFIPNVITLNIPTDGDLSENERPARFVYDDETATMEIKFTEFLAITDGYHRFVAMEREKHSNPDFDYPMGIMLTNFPVNREQQYIYQEDQKTKMSKVASESLNQQNAATQIVERMINKTSFSLHDMIKRNQGQISAPVLNAIINALYGNKMSRAMIMETETEIEVKFEQIVKQDYTLLDRKWDWRFLMCAMVAMYNGNTNLDDINKFYDSVHKNVIKADPAKIDRTVVNRFLKRYEEIIK